MIKLSGDINRLMKDVSHAKVASVISQLDEELGDLTKETADEMKERAPIETGLLKATVRSGLHHRGVLEWSIDADLDTAPYLWRQNFEHKTKRYYITIPANKAEMAINPRLQKVIDDAW